MPPRRTTSASVPPQSRPPSPLQAGEEDEEVTSIYNIEAYAILLPYMQTPYFDAVDELQQQVYCFSHLSYFLSMLTTVILAGHQRTRYFEVKSACTSVQVTI